MEITGKIIKVLPLQSGQGKNGEWKKQEFVIQSEGQYPKNVCFTLWGAQIEQSPLDLNLNVKISFDPESREFNGKWYTDLKAWRVIRAESAPNTVTDNEGYIQAQPEVGPDNVTDDLPF